MAINQQILRKSISKFYANELIIIVAIRFNWTSCFTSSNAPFLIIMIFLESCFARIDPSCIFFLFQDVGCFSKSSSLPLVLSHPYVSAMREKLLHTRMKSNIERNRSNKNEIKMVVEGEEAEAEAELISDLQQV